MCSVLYLRIIALISITIITTAEVRNEFLNLFKDTDYPKNDLRAKFLNEKKRNNATYTRMKLLDKILNDSLYVDGLMHFEANSVDLKDKLKMKRIENDFKNIIGMNGLTYIYKRDMHWRTWRSVQFSNGPQLIYYKCQSSVNCSTCSTGGYWNIVEDIPPCPYEIFSITNDSRLCVANLTQLPDIEEYYNKCISNISFGDLSASCDNPIETHWVITKKVTSRPEVFPKICGDHGICNIFTIYTISSDYISFRIINSTNHIIYSKIMKNGGKHYICVTNCGIYDRLTKKIIVTTKDIPFQVDLFKKKRENADFDKNEICTKKNLNVKKRL